MSILAKIDPGPAPADSGLTQPRLKVLVVDDDETNRAVLEIMLCRDGHEVCTARDGGEAVALYGGLQPDVILMDVMMPAMNGYDATREIKSLAGDHFVPIIFITALADEQVLAKCLEVGGDDFLTKPVSRVVLRAKLAAAARIHGLYARLEGQRQELSSHHDRLRYEHEVAEQVFAKIVGSARTSAANIKSELLPLAITNGDLLLVADTPGGAQHILLGDCTGHGLSAAIGAIPVTDIFYAMSRKGFGIGEIVSEMNRKLRATLPTGQFLAACMAAWAPGAGQLKIWNGGVPDALLISGRNRDITRLPSRNLALGIVDSGSFTVNIETRRVEQGDRLYLYSDGLVDAADRRGRMFGTERLAAVIRANQDRGTLFDELRTAVAAFRDGQPQDDDISLVEVLCDEQLLRTYRGPVAPPRRSLCNYAVRLGPRAMAGFDPLALVELLSAAVPALERHKSHLYTVVMELYTNALEHGVLGLDGTLKETPDGFGGYYAERERRLADLQEGWIHIDAECQGDQTGGEVVLQLEDSGKGFDAECRPGEGDLLMSGRGMKLVESLCAGLSYDQRGSYVRAVYAW